MHRFFLATALAMLSLTARAVDGYQYISPQPGSILNSTQAGVIIRHGDPIEPDSVHPGSVEVIGSIHGDYPGRLFLAADGTSLLFDPDADFALREVVTVYVRDGLKTVGGADLPEISFTFSTITDRSPSAEGAALGGKGAGEDATAPFPHSEEESTDPLPAPPITVNHTNNPAPGTILLATWDRNIPAQYGNFLYELDGAGNILRELRVDGALFDFQRQPNGHYSYALGEFAGNVPGADEQLRHVVMDADFNLVDTYEMKNGYPTDFHEFLLLPNGHSLMMSYLNVTFDMGTIVPGGRPDATLVLNIIQEQDPDRNVVFEWRNIDHIPITDSDLDLTGTRINYSTLNGFELDRDGHLLASFRNHSEIMKISRTTGEILWRCGSPRGTFTIVGENEANAPYYFARQHDIRRLANGNISIFDNGQFHTPPYSRSAEYELDEENQILTLVSEYRYPAGNIFAAAAGSAQPLPSGGWFLCYGILAPFSPVKRQIVEYHADGSTALELSLPNGVIAYRARKVPPDPGAITVTRSGMTNDQWVVFDDADAVTGISMQIEAIDGGGTLSATVSRESLAPLDPGFAGIAPRLLPLRVMVTGAPAGSHDVVLVLDAVDFGLVGEGAEFGYVDPETVTVYHRAGPDADFAPLATTYNPVTQELSAPASAFGEFVLGIPEVTEVPLEPILVWPEDGNSVNQEYLVNFLWTPRGFARSSHLQVASDPGFNNLLVDETALMDYGYSWSIPNPDTSYWYRVRIHNDGGQGEWSTASFQAVPPTIQVMTPNGGEAWTRGIREFIRWDDNIDDSVILDLLKGGIPVLEIGTVPSSGTYQWEVDLGAEAGTDYSIRVRSAADLTLSDSSDQSFHIGVPTISDSRLDENGDLVLEWSGAVLNISVDYAPEIPASPWQQIDGPFIGTSWTNRALSLPGVYRLRSE